MQKNVEKTDRQKYIFFAIFGGFGSPRRRFLAIFGPKTGPRRLLFRCFLENGDFVKIVLLLAVGTRFCRVGPFKIVLPPQREHDFDKITVFEKTPKK